MQEFHLEYWDNTKNLLIPLLQMKIPCKDYDFGLKIFNNVYINLKI